MKALDTGGILLEKGDLLTVEVVDSKGTLRLKINNQPAVNVRQYSTLSIGRLLVNGKARVTAAVESIPSSDA